MRKYHFLTNAMFAKAGEAFAPVVRKRPKHGGEKTTLLIGYRLVSEFEVPPLTA